MYNSPLTVCAAVCAFLVSVALAFSPIHADIIDSGDFSRSEPSGSGFIVATSTFELDALEIPDICFEANFDLIDAGIEILVNGQSLFNTGDDVSNFGPQVFQPTAVQPDNIDFSFSPNDNNLPRLTVLHDAMGSDFSGAAFVNSTNTVDYIPLFNVSNFNSLLQAGTNTIEIINLNGFQGANLIGDYTVKSVAAVPEPSAIAVCMVAGLIMMKRRRRHL